MTKLSNQQKQLLLDYCLGLTSEEESSQAEQLIDSSKDAAQIHSKITASLVPLETVELEPCPDDLVESTIWRLNESARSSQVRLQQLLASEQVRDVAVKSRLWWNLGKTVAAAAVILIVLGTWFAPLDFIRHRSRQHQCQMQLARIFQGLTNYISDHDGQMPTVATTAGAPWWKVGYQGKENHSATRSVWLLVKDGYVDAANFMCPGRDQSLVIQIDPVKLNSYNDFPARDYIAYSVRIGCRKSKSPAQRARKVLIADLSPLFENLPRDFGKPFKLQLSEDMLVLNSANHNRRGQNVLFCNGSVTFIKQRHTDISSDDIFTLREMHLGSEVKGFEVPSCETDTFLAP
jgi:hypothetical protein